jgi:hypothetical protein
LLIAGAASPDRYFEDPDVGLIVRRVLDADSVLLVRFAKDAVLTDRRREADARFSLNPHLQKPARDIAEAGARILGRPDRGQLRGALAQRLVYELVHSREPSADVEVSFNLTPPGQVGHTVSNPKDVATDADPVEVYECKRRAERINQADLDELAAIHKAGQAHGRDVIATVACLESSTALSLALQRLTIRPPLFHACEDDLLELRDMWPRRRLTKGLAGHR